MRKPSQKDRFSGKISPPLDAIVENLKDMIELHLQLILPGELERQEQLRHLIADMIELDALQSTRAIDGDEPYH